MLQLLAPHKKKKIPINELQELWEFCTGMTRSDKIVPVWHTAKAFTQEVLKRYHARGHLARDITLKPDCDRVGIYKIVIEDDVPFLECRIVPGTRRIDEVIYGSTGPSKLYVVKNWSETGAQIVDADGLVNHNCLALFRISAQLLHSA